MGGALEDMSNGMIGIDDRVGCVHEKSLFVASRVHIRRKFLILQKVDFKATSHALFTVFT